MTTPCRSIAGTRLVTGHGAGIPAALHDAVTPLSFLLGRWAGEGEGSYPTIEPFGYGEEITVSHVGKPFLAYAQRTWSLDDGRPLHAETGYWRCASPTHVELVVAHPTGVVELSEGPLTATSLVLSSKHGLGHGQRQGRHRRRAPHHGGGRPPRLRARHGGGRACPSPTTCAPCCGAWRHHRLTARRGSTGPRVRRTGPRGRMSPVDRSSERT